MDREQRRPRRAPGRQRQGGPTGERRKIADRYVKGETLAELAHHYECGEATVWRVLRAFDVIKRRRTRAA